MSAISKASGSTVVPCLRYRNAPDMIEWLCRVFGFEKQLVVDGADGTIAHAQLSLGTGMVMLGSVLKSETEFGKLMKQPDEIGGAQTQSSYLVVADADAVLARAQANGAKVVLPIKDEDYGGRGFTCRDPEGHIWSVGTYDPWTDGS
jgi:uncharacterized glyoxalase superfamily protein PhnB